MNRKSRERKAENLEERYVHHVYSSQASSYDVLCDGPWPDVKNFLHSLQPGSVVLDVGCGNGKYLTLRNDIFIHGVDICHELSQLAYKRSKNIIIGNNLKLPYISSSMDAVISIAVLHHFATQERRQRAVSELVRLLKPGGQVLIYVCAWEHRLRKFDSQDVLIPWAIANTKNGENSSLRVYDNLTELPAMDCQSKQDEKKIIEKKDFLSAIDDDVLVDELTHERAASLLHSLAMFKPEFRELKCFADNKLFSNIERTFSDESDLQICHHAPKLCDDNHRTENCNHILQAAPVSKNTSHKPHACKKTANSRNNKVTMDSMTPDYRDSQIRHTERFERFYHVFVKDELSNLVREIPGLRVVKQYYDHGNWVVNAIKETC